MEPWSRVTWAMTVTMTFSLSSARLPTGTVALPLPCLCPSSPAHHTFTLPCTLTCQHLPACLPAHPLVLPCLLIPACLACLCLGQSQICLACLPWTQGSAALVCCPPAQVPLPACLPWFPAPCPYTCPLPWVWVPALPACQDFACLGFGLHLPAPPACLALPWTCLADYHIHTPHLFPFGSRLPACLPGRMPRIPFAWEGCLLPPPAHPLGTATCPPHLPHTLPACTHHT